MANPVGRPKKLSGVYALICNETKQVKYIGQSINIKARINQHRAAKGELPVNLWCKELKLKGINLEYKILELCNNPIDREKYWIDLYKQKNIKLLNLHQGGKNTWYEGGKSCKLWIASDNFSPYKEWQKLYLPYTYSNIKIRKIVSDFKSAYKLCKTESEKIMFQIHCANILYSNFGKKYLKLIENWAKEIQPKVNIKYPNLFKIEYI